MNSFQTKALELLRTQGYAVTVWSPDDLRGADPLQVEAQILRSVKTVIDPLADPDFKPNDELDEGEVLVQPPITAATQAQYLYNSGALCPFCDSSNIEAQNLEMDGAQAWSDCTCNDCQKEWKDEYTLTGYSVKA